MLGKGGDKKLVEAVPAAAHNDIGYKLATHPDAAARRQGSPKRRR